MKTGPHVGMSDEPCAVVPGPKSSTDETYSSGNLPMCRRLSVVKSGGGIFSEAAAGPFPLASVPWQAEQNCR